MRLAEKRITKDGKKPFFPSQQRAYRAAETNGAFSWFGYYSYNSTNKTLESRWAEASDSGGGGGDDNKAPNPGVPESPPGWED